MSNSQSCARCGEKCVRNFGIVENGGAVVVPLCSPECRDIMRRSASDVKPGASMSSKPKKARKPPRTPGEIKKALRPSEKAVSKTIRDDMKTFAAYSTRLQAGQIKLESRYLRLCEPGTPDSVFASGLVCFVEIKKPDERASDDQKRVQRDLSENGALVFTVDNVGDYLFIKSELRKRAARVAEINKLIAAIQSEIDRARENKK